MQDLTFYRSSSAQLIFVFKEGGDPFEGLSDYDAKMRIFPVGTLTVHTEIYLLETETGRLEHFFEVPDVKSLPASARYDILLTDKQDSTRVINLPPASLRVSNVQRNDTVVSVVEVAVSDSIENIVNVSFGTTPLQGPKGEAGTIEVGDVTTGAPGSNVVIENTGTPESALLNFTIPRGDEGDDGREVEIQRGFTHLQWRYVDDPTWNDIISIEEITGDDGRGIESIELHETQGLVKTYRITFTDSTTFDFDVTDGQDGGIQNIESAPDTDFTNRQVGDLLQITSIDPLMVQRVNPATVLDSQYALPVPMRLNPEFWFEARKFESFSLRQDGDDLFTTSLKSLVGEVEAVQETESMQPLYEAGHIFFQRSGIGEDEGSSLFLADQLDVGSATSQFLLSVKYMTTAGNSTIFSTVSFTGGTQANRSTDLNIWVGGSQIAFDAAPHDVFHTLTLRVDRDQNTFDAIYNDTIRLGETSGSATQSNFYIGSRANGRQSLAGRMPGLCIAQGLFSDKDFFDLHNYMRQI